jgi:hypothetical protein
MPKQDTKPEPTTPIAPLAAVPTGGGALAPLRRFRSLLCAGYEVMVRIDPGEMAPLGRLATARGRAQAPRSRRRGARASSGAPGR